MKLSLGVIDQPYNVARSRRAKRIAGNKTTGDVAEILESRYHIFEHFWQLHQQDVADDIASSLQGAVQSLMMGAPASISPFGAAESKIADRMKQMLSNKELDALGYPGIPTQAALRGVSHRFRRPYVRRGPRPSFIDTGLMQASMAAEVS